MKISYNWLKEYVGFDLEVDKVADILTSLGLEVEGVSELFSSFDHLLIGKVVDCIKHPNADKLKLTKVDIGNEIKTIVCGAPNIEKDLIVVVVKEGKSLINNKGEVFKIKKTKIRGEISEGMICSEYEIGLGLQHDGIMVINDANIKIGSLAKDYFNISKDYCLEIGITPNRTDALGHIGVARDLHAYLMIHHANIGFKKCLKLPDISKYQCKKDDLKVDIEVLDALLCPLYVGVCIKNVIVQDSPNWLKNKLISIGLKPVNNVVDITNFVLHETGNPLHAFDYNKLSNSQIMVRQAKINEPFLALDGRELKLKQDNLVICDDENVLCLAGVMGGAYSAVQSSTENIFLECAYFAPSSVRKTSKEHGILSDASYRFERGVDFNNCEYALRRAAILIQDICNGTISFDSMYESGTLQSKKVNFSFNRFNKIVGDDIDKNIIIDILKNLDFKISNISTDECLLEVPSFRVDVYREIDIVEEIIRVYGYDNIKVADNVNFNTDSLISPNKNIKNIISKFLAFNGFFEIRNNSLTKPSTVRYNAHYLKNKVVNVINPLSQDLSIMRMNLLYGGLETIKYNLNRQQDDLKLYEFGKIYSTNESGYVESDKLGIFMSGNFKGSHWKAQSREFDFFIARGVLDQLISKFCNNTDIVIKKSLSTYFDIGVTYYHGKKMIAEVGLIDATMLNELGIKQAVYYVDLDFKLFNSLNDDAGRVKNNEIIFKKIPKYPKIKRDLSLLMDSNITYQEIVTHVKSISSQLLVNVSLFDVYKGDKVQAGKQSYAMSFIFQDDRMTLTDDQIDREMIHIYKSLQNKFKLSLRDGELG